MMPSGSGPSVGGGPMYGGMAPMGVTRTPSSGAQMGGQMGGPMGPQMGPQMGAQMGGQMGMMPGRGLMGGMNVGGSGMPPMVTPPPGMGGPQTARRPYPLPGDMMGMMGKGAYGEFTMHNDDFPALTGGGSIGQMPPYKQQQPLGARNDDMSHLQEAFKATQISDRPPSLGRPNEKAMPYIGGEGSGLGHSVDLSLDRSRVPSSMLPTSSATSSSTSSLPPQQPPKHVTQSDSYGLLGLLKVIRKTDKDLEMLAIGSDLTTLGINLSSNEPLHLAYSNPWGEVQQRREPDFRPPAPYYHVTLPQPTQKMQNFAEFTLFYIFYAFPRDALQEAAAQQLLQRKWIYHKEHKIWLMRDPQQEPIEKTAVYERGWFIYFDPTQWEKIRKEMMVYYDHLVEERKPAAR